MPRKLVTEQEPKTVLNEGEAKEKLTQLTRDYIENKDREKEYKDAASAQNTEIKTIMTKYGITEASADNGTVTLSERVTEDFVEERLIDYLKSRGLADGIIKTKEYVDFDALESAIYHEQITGDNLKDMDSCKDKKTTLVLRIKK